MNKTLYDLPENCNFSEAQNNSSQSFSCSPKLKDPYFSEFQGILVNGPLLVEWPEKIIEETPLILPNGDTQVGPKLIISGLVKLPYDTLGLDGDLAKHILLVAVNQNTAESYSGKLKPFGFSVKPDIPGFAESQKGIDTTEYFNIDLIQNLRVPIATANYSIYAVLGEHKSNVIEIKISIK